MTEPSTDRYPAAWRQGESPRAAGVVVLEPQQVRLEGRREGRQHVDTVPYATIRLIRTARFALERLGGPTLVVERHDCGPLLIEPHGLGMLHELHDALADAASVA